MNDRETARNLSKKLEKAYEENALLRRKIENHIIMTEAFQKDYNLWLDTLKGDDDGDSKIFRCL